MSDYANLNLFQNKKNAQALTTWPFLCILSFAVFAKKEPRHFNLSKGKLVMQHPCDKSLLP